MNIPGNAHIQALEPFLRKKKIHSIFYELFVNKEIDKYISPFLSLLKYSSLSLEFIVQVRNANIRMANNFYSW